MGSLTISTAILEPAASADALPVCLWKENPNRLVSLWDIVKPFFPVVFTTLSAQFNIPGVDVDLAVGGAFGRAAIPSNTKETAQQLLPTQRRYCAELGLIASIATIDRLLNLLSKPDATLGELHELGKELRGRLNDELFGTVFFSLTYSESEYYNKPTEGWREIIERFPMATTDIEEMSKCFALSRYAGAVFYSIQTIECALIEFGKFLNVNDPKSGWTAVNGKLATLVTKTKYPDLDPLYQTHFAFLEQMHGTVGALNSAWRNKISHAQGRLVLMTSEFSPEVAEEIIIASRSFMRRLATELPT
jgi:hypothetical protein